MALPKITDRVSGWVLSVLCLLIFIPWLWQYSLPLTGDQRIYLNIALEMFEKGDWLTPYLFDQPSFQKPPFHYWLILIGWKIFGLSLFGALLPSVLLLLGLALCTHYLSRIIYRDSSITLGGLWIIPTIGALTFGTSAQMEISQAFFYALSWVFGLKYLVPKYNERNIRLIYLAFAIAGLSGIIKSPLYSVFWVAGYLMYLLVSGEWDLFRSRHLYLAWLLGIVIGCLWFIWALFFHGFGFWDQYFSYETYLKSYTKHGSNSRMWLSLIYQGLPLSILLIPFFRGLRSWRRSGALIRFLFGFCFLPAFFFTLYPYKVSTYLFLIFPALALCLDWGLLREGKSLFFKITLQTLAIFLGFALIVAAAIVPLYDLLESRSLHSLTIFIFLSLAAGFVVSGIKNAIRPFILCSFLLILMIRFISSSIGELDIAPLRKFQKEVPEIGLLDDSKNVWNERGLLSATLGKPLRRFETYDSVVNGLSENVGIILTESQSAQYLAALQAYFKSNLIITPWLRWKSKREFGIKTFLKGKPEERTDPRKEFVLLKLK